MPERHGSSERKKIGQARHSLSPEISDQAGKRRLPANHRRSARTDSLQVLADVWKTNYFTAQNGLAPLINEGLLESRPGRGTFVAENPLRLKTVGIYYGGEFWANASGAFYQALYLAIEKELEDRGMGARLFIDSRHFSKQTTPFKPLQDAIKNRAMNAVIALALNPENCQWVETLPLPFSVLSTRGHARCVSMDIPHLAKSSLKRMAGRGCRRVGLITAASSTAPLDEIFLEFAQAMGLRTSPAWVRCMPQGTENCEEFGFEKFKEIWEQPERPDGLLVYPDNIGRGVMSGALSKGVRVPQELCLVMHRVEQTPFYSPLAVDWQLFSTVKTARALIDLVQQQAEGSPFKQVLLKTVLKPG